MRRREFIGLVGGAAAVWPFVAWAEQSSVPVLGFLASASEAAYTTTLAAVRRGLNEAGYVEKQNLLIEYRWANFQYERLPALAAELTKRPVDAIFATGSVVSAIAAKSATANIPIVFANGSDPVQYGLVASLNRPGGNVTGVKSLNVELTAKRLGLLRELAPQATRFVALVAPNAALTDAIVKVVHSSVPTLGFPVEILYAGNSDRDIEAAFATFAQRGAGALFVGTSAFLNSRRERVAALALRHALPANFAQREFATAGGLMSYGASATDAYRLGGIYAGRILKGERPANLPVQQSTKFEFVINLRTAKALGLEVPDKLLALADEVIE